MKKIIWMTGCFLALSAGVAVAQHDHHEHEEHEGTSGALPERKPSEQCEHDHQEHEGHEGHDHGVHDDHDREIELSDEIAEKAGIRVLKANGGEIVQSLDFPAEIRLNRNRSAAISPRYPSVVRQVFAEIGDEVRKGDVLASLENRETLTVYSVSTPLDGVIVSKDLSIGETVAEDCVLYEVADLSSVWVDISVFPKYQHLVRKGMRVELIAHGGHSVHGTIQYISPLISHETRTFTARCVLEQAQEDFTPGAFVRARVTAERVDADVVVPLGAVQFLDGEPVVFVPGEHGFQTLEVRTGLSDDSQVEVVSGLKPGDAYVAVGAFSLKAQMITSGMDPHAGHGH